MRPEILVEVCPPIDGCSPPSLCDVTLETFLCSLRSLLPPGEIWRRNVEEQDQFYRVCTQIPTVVNSPLCEPVPPDTCPDLQTLRYGLEHGCDPCLKDQGSVLVGLVDSFAVTQYQLFCFLCAFAQELDPCLATETVDQKFSELGFDRCTSYDLCDACFRAMPKELETAVKKIIICLSEQVGLGVVVNDDFLQSILGLFGYSANFVSIGDINCVTLSDLYICEAPSRTPKVRPPEPLTPCDFFQECDPTPRCWELASRTGDPTFTPIDPSGCAFYFDCDPVPCWDRSPEFGLRLCRIDATLQVEGCLTPIRAVLPPELVNNLFRPGCTEVNRPLDENVLLGVALCLSERLIPVNSRRFIEADCCPVCPEPVP